MKTHDLMYVAGHTGLVGSAIMRALKTRGFNNLLVRTVQELDLRDQQAVNHFFAQYKPAYIFLAAAKVGGIQANFTYPAQFLYDNLMISANIIHAAYMHGAKKLLFLGSSCIYPRLCPQPIKEEYLMTGPLEKTNEAYALAKISGIGLCQAYRREYGANFISCMPTNLYGPGDNFDLNAGHVMPALIAKLYAAHHEGNPECVIWGTGTPLREFLFVDDLADALIFLMRTYESSEPINIGSGQEVSIGQLAALISEIVGYRGRLIFDASKPDGTPRKLLDCSNIHNLGWRAKTSLAEGIKLTLEYYMMQQGRKKSFCYPSIQNS
jgi:GDP-L-fucose synthase